ncbi:MAG: Filamentation induced by cAMP protein Fic [Candidatus Nomurabacteria bacterium GW2011_GWA1_37_20]|uniref:Filamentation induced by cAMP protein Fic n=2 Tax=Parcubacteria group TaxID=1794811 RepID=A0A0G0KFQ7_9BACT|nr:MAG: Filamentation induced by cAMP protein Fic [Parcubacteria group bacterium GW2011_GWC1_36_9]KKQ26811.1 MAG: Filamentation induced by cAMP protein Fic [Parcubacteria group bacterium GW2011_GWB1_37_13]KKQ29977.1 MAG: Filamentation induced by cAMP protein Fic [Candidatus Nomurabacteria bacterium GW2011_GWA1_37_20]KKQ48034.1 MAG: Filamentation induced by cAMP protein Fic [Candidatus Yanofskybacteria bacterium GW2011_GWC2_37_9]
MELGKFIQQNNEQWGKYNAFIPNPFPPKGGFGFPESLIKQDAQAQHFVSTLNGITKLLPDVDFFIFMYILKDASSSSQIEGTGATMLDALEAEAKIGSDLPEDVDDIIHYIKALNNGIDALKEIPISERLIKKLHKDLMAGARHTQYPHPGKFRHDQNWINGTSPRDAKFVPPPSHELSRTISDWEKFVHVDDNLLPLTKAALLHAQFETIHPFRDGNGRTGRMLTTLYLREAGLLEKPVLFLSAYLKKHQQVYSNRLLGYSNGEINEWIQFFLSGVSEIAEEAIETVYKITKLREQDILQIQGMDKRSSKSAIEVLPKLFALPIVDTSIIQKWTGFTRNGSQKLIDRFVDLGILSLRDVNKKYNKSYIYKNYVDIFYKIHTGE